MFLSNLFPSLVKHSSPTSSHKLSSEMAKQKSLFCSLLFCMFMVMLWCECEVIMGKKSVPVRVGVVLHFNSTVGKMGRSCLSIALHDFYSTNSDYGTKLALFFKDSKDDVVDAASSGTYIIMTFNYIFGVNLLSNNVHHCELQVVWLVFSLQKLLIMEISVSSPNIKFRIYHFN